MKENNGVIRQQVTFDEFVQVFKVFESFPFFERWTQEELKQEYETFRTNGTIFGYYLDGQCVGLLTLRPWKKGEHPVEYPDEEKVMYLSDVATLYICRNRGVGTALFHQAIEHTKVLGYHHIYLRTNETNSMSYGIAKKCGFRPIFDVCQEVERTRIDGTVCKDLRIFMQKELSEI